MIWQLAGLKTYSIGSSSVMMWSWRCGFTSCTMAASVVDLPEPTAPVMRTRPFWYWVRAFEVFGQAEFIHGADLGVDDAEDAVVALALLTRGAEAGEAGDVVAEIERPVLLQRLELRRVEEAADERLGIRRG